MAENKVEEILSELSLTGEAVLDNLDKSPEFITWKWLDITYQSIVKWRNIRFHNGNDHKMQNCALCQEADNIFARPLYSLDKDAEHHLCDYCPLGVCIAECDDVGSPYWEWNDYLYSFEHGLHSAKEDKSLGLADNMIYMLFFLHYSIKLKLYIKYKISSYAYFQDNVEPELYDYALVSWWALMGCSLGMGVYNG